jgi:SAM-dependent methyltransferase
MKFAPYWQGEDGIRNIIPRAGNRGEYPERPGFDPLKILPEIIKGRPVVEIGCGYGRLCTAFEPDKYVGCDPNRAAIEEASAKHPDYSFHVLDEYRYPPSMAKLAYTVAMHIPDDEYPEFVKAICESTGDQVVIAEILGAHKRRDLEKKREGWIHATFGREMITHEQEFYRNGFSLVTYHVHKYPGKGEFTFLDFRKNYDKAN